MQQAVSRQAGQQADSSRGKLEVGYAALLFAKTENVCAKVVWANSESASTL